MRQFRVRLEQLSGERVTYNTGDIELMHGDYIVYQQLRDRFDEQLAKVVRQKRLNKPKYEDRIVVTQAISVHTIKAVVDNRFGVGILYENKSENRLPQVSCY